MNDSRTGLEGKTKRELVALLFAEVSAWPGNAPLGTEALERVRKALALLSRCQLWIGEGYWHGLCCIWSERSGRPDAWLRQSWLEILQQWLCFLDDVGFQANFPPVSEQSSRKPLAILPKMEPWYLPLGFVKPWM